MSKYDKLKCLKIATIKAAYGLVNLLLPPRCPVTGEVVDRPGMVSPEAWAALRFVSEPHCACCGLPFEVVMEAAPDISDETLCGPCLAEPKVYARARSSLVYDDASRALILAFKHGDKTDLTVTFGPWLATAGQALAKDADVIVPVPLHWMRLLRRRYNQAALLAHAMSQSSGTMCWPDVLTRNRNTQTQGHLNFKQRHENVRNVFALKDKYADQIRDKKIILIDDVYTTGATIEECTKVLMNAGAQRVDVVTLARVVRPELVA